MQVTEQATEGHTHKNIQPHISSLALSCLLSGALVPTLWGVCPVTSLCVLECLSGHQGLPLGIKCQF